MGSGTSYLVVGLLLGALVGALLVAADHKRRAAMTKIRGFAGEQKKARKILQEAKTKRSQGYAELPVSFLLLLFALLVLIFICALARVALS